MDKSLFARLGGSEGIRRIVDDVVALHMENPVVRARFRPVLETPDRLEVIKQHTCAFLESGSGGSAKYQGRDMRTAHKGMNINATEYMAVVDDIVEALRKNQVDEQTQKDVLFIAYSLKGDIVHL